MQKVETDEESVTRRPDDPDERKQPGTRSPGSDRPARTGQDVLSLRRVVQAAELERAREREPVGDRIRLVGDRRRARILGEGGLELGAESVRQRRPGPGDRAAA